MLMKTFTFGNSGVIFLWGQGSIDAWGAGYAEVTVPYSVIKPSLTPDGLRIQIRVKEDK